MCPAAEYEHKLLWGGLASVYGAALTDDGSYIMGGAITPGGTGTFYINDDPISGQYGNVELAVVRGISNSLDWIGVGYVQGSSYTRIIKTGVVQNWTGFTYQVNGSPRLAKNGVAVWQYGNDDSYEPIFKDNVEYSTAWTTGYFDALLDITSDGRTLWQGITRGTSVTEVWFDGQPIGRSYSTPGYHGYKGSHINDSAALAWLAEKDGSPAVYHAFYNGVDLTTPTFGAGGRAWDSSSPLINSGGDVVWVGTPEGQFLSRIVLNNTVLHADLIPDGQGARLFGFNDHRDILWALGAGSFNFQLYANDFDLSTDVYGAGNYSDPFAFGLNEQGQILWTANNKATGLKDIWLSTPVPEPSLTACLPLVVLGLARRYRTRR